MSTTTKTHAWRFFRAGGFDQVRLDTGADLMGLGELDQKLWVALACPIAGLEFDRKTAELIDTDRDGRIRAAELIAAVQWAGGALKNPELLVKGGDSIRLSDINDGAEQGRQILASARRLLGHLGLPENSPITLAQAMEANHVFSQARFNGDGVIIPECADDAATSALISEIADCAGAVNDRCGKPGIDQPRADNFFEACAAFDAWMRQSETDAVSIFPAGAGTAAAAAAVKAIKAKVDDYFSRCRVAAFDARALPMLNRAPEDYVAFTTKALSANAAELASFPLATVAAGKPLSLVAGVNPAHGAAVDELRTAAIKPLLGDRVELAEADWLALQARLAPFENWMAAKPGASVEKLGAARVGALAAGSERVAINELIAKDKALEAEASQAANVEKLIRFVRDLHRLSRNFVNFGDLYLGGGPAIFQCGTLYLDSRACSLCLTVEDAGRHAAMAGLSGAYLAYCDCVRKGSGEKLSIVAIVSQGDDENLMTGRNGVFYDRLGRDYDATITRIVASPISLRQAFGAPYKKLARAVEEYTAKRAATAEADVQAQMTAIATAQSGAAAPAKPLFDPSVVALLSLAVGSLAAGAATVLAALGKVPLLALPLALAGIALVVSSPSLILAYLKLRKRNLGPILDANGWAINSRARINVPFGERLTTVAKLPGGAIVEGADAYAEKPVVWPKLVGALLVVLWALAVCYKGLDSLHIPYHVTHDVLHWTVPIGTPPPPELPAGAAAAPAGTNAPSNK